LGDRVVGVTRFCRNPPEARSKRTVGGYYDPNYETILSLRPDVVIMLPEHEEQKRHVTRLGLRVLVLDHRGIDGILDSIATIGQACGAEEKAATLARDLRGRIERVQHKTNRLPRPRVIVSVGRNMGSGALRSVYLSGRQGFYNELIELAGGENAYQGSAAFPVFSVEGIARLNPDVIIDLVTDLEEHGWERARILKEWETAFPVNAVRNGRVHVLGQDYVVVPGPRFILILEEIARIIHPEAGWEKP
jgi:iron complex transport system substrate-binding protein